MGNTVEPAMKRFLLVMRPTLRISCSIPNNTEVHGRTFTRIRFPVTSTTMFIAPRGVDHQSWLGSAINPPHAPLRIEPYVLKFVCSMRPSFS